MVESTLDTLNTGYVSGFQEAFSFIEATKNLNQVKELHRHNK